MARNGAGTYTLPAGNPVTTGTTISSSWANNTLNDIASSLTASIAYDGQTAPVANLPMATYAHTNVGNATVRNMYASAAQVQDSTLQYLTSVSGTNTIAATAPISMSALAAGQIFRFIAAATNTGGVTLNINSIGARAITKNGTTPLSANDILINSAVQVLYDGTQFQLLNIAASIPPGVITMWSGTIATIPTGWLLCNGSSGTPDLRNRFIIGAFQDTSGVAYTTITGADTQTGGTKDAIVVSHTHTATVTDPGHRHTVGISAIPDSGSGSPNRMTDSGSTNTSTVTTGITVSNSTEGSSGTNQNLPPYYALAFIMKA
jgi:hypothetical protein